MPSRADLLVKKLIRELWKERDRITDQIAGLSKLSAVPSASRPKGRRLSLVRGKSRKKG